MKKLSVQEEKLIRDKINFLTESNNSHKFNYTAQLTTLVSYSSLIIALIIIITQTIPANHYYNLALSFSEFLMIFIILIFTICFLHSLKSIQNEHQKNQDKIKKLYFLLGVNEELKF